MTREDAIAESVTILRPVFSWMKEEALQRVAEGYARMKYPELEWYVNA
jgi:hypothetical protein